jgi:glycosyltransferase involved in cell wall biosynthesis
VSQAEYFSIVVPCYNCADTLSETLESVIAQSFQNYRIYAIDDGSKDETPKVLANYHALLGDKLVWRSQPNAGQVKTKNRALQIVQGEVICFLDSDDLWEPEKLQVQHDIFQKQAEVGLVYCNGHYIDSDSQKKKIYEVDPALRGKCFGKLLMGNAIVASSVAVRRSVIEAVGNFDENLSACENWELWLRVAQVSELEALEDTLVSYRQHENNMSLDIDKMRNNRLAVLEKYRRRIENGDRIGQRALEEAFFKAHRAFGEYYLWRLRLRAARQELKKALSIHPWNWTCLKLYLKTFLGRAMLSRRRSQAAIP